MRNAASRESMDLVERFPAVDASEALQGSVLIARGAEYLVICCFVTGPRTLSRAFFGNL